MLIPKEGRLLIAQRLFNGAGDLGDEIDLILWKNDYVPTLDSVMADLTDSTFTGYGPTSTQWNKFSASALDGDFAVSRLHAMDDADFFRWFVNGAPHTIYGWALQHNDSGTCIGIERFVTPIVPVIGTVITLFIDYDLGKFVAD